MNKQRIKWIKKHYKIIISSLIFILYLSLKFGIYNNYIKPRFENNIEISLYGSDIPYNAIKERLDDHVEDYHVTIQFHNLNTSFIKDDPVKFGVSMIDDGIIKLKNPYFIIYIANPENIIVSRFPKGNSINEYWNFQDKVWTAQGTIWIRDTVQVEQEKIIYYFPLDTIFNSGGTYAFLAEDNTFHRDKGNILYVFKDTTLVGRWCIYVLVYDREYYDIKGNRIDGGKAVGVNQQFFDVKEDIIIERDPVDIILYWMEFILAAAAIFSLFPKILTITENRIRKKK